MSKLTTFWVRENWSKCSRKTATLVCSPVYHFSNSSLRNVTGSFTTIGLGALAEWSYRAPSLMLQLYESRQLLVGTLKSKTSRLTPSGRRIELSSSATLEKNPKTQTSAGTYYCKLVCLSTEEFKTPTSADTFNCNASYGFYLLFSDKSFGKICVQTLVCKRTWSCLSRARLQFPPHPSKKYKFILSRA